LNQAAATNKIRNYRQVIKLMHSHNIHIPLPTMKTNIQNRFVFQAAMNHLIACESSDSMYVARPQQAEILQDRNGRPALQTQRRQASPTQLHPSPQQQRPARRRRPLTQQRPGLNASSRRQRLDAEAESTSEEETSGLSADESDTNAAELYRSAMLGVRNRPNAVKQVSAAAQGEITSYIHSSGLTRYHAQFALNSWNSFAIFDTIEKQQRRIMHIHMPLPQLINRSI
jgi:hypothetical protein